MAGHQLLAAGRVECNSQQWYLHGRSVDVAVFGVNGAVELDVSCSGLVAEDEVKDDDASTLVLSLNTDLLFIDPLLPLLSLEL